MSVYNVFFTFLISVKVVMILSILGQHIEIFRKKIKFINFIICLELVPIRIRQNDAKGLRVPTGNSFQPRFRSLYLVEADRPRRLAVGPQAKDEFIQNKMGWLWELLFFISR
jgi:hypothetical protein